MNMRKSIETLNEEQEPARPCIRHQSYIQRFGSQFTALFIKNCLVSSRNWQATLARVLIAPLLFTFCVWAINQALTKNNANFDPSRNISNPNPVAVAPIPDCRESIFNKLPCYDFVYGPTGDATFDALAESMRANNPGRIIPATAVRGFSGRDAANAYEAANPETVRGGVFFERLGGENIGFVLQANMSTLNFHGKYQNPNLYIQVPLQVAAERSIAQLQFGRVGRSLAAADWTVALSSFAHPAVSSFSLVGILLAPFTFAAVMFAFVLVIAGVVAERELKLRQALRTMGMLDSAFWLSWSMTENILALFTALLLAGFGAMWQFDLFKRNSFSLPFVLFLLFLMAMSSLAFLLSTVVKKASTAINLGFVIFIIGWIMQVIVVFGFPYSPTNMRKFRFVAFLFGLCPWSVLAKGFNDLGLAASGSYPGLTFGERFSYCKNVSFQEQTLQPVAAGRYIDFQCVLPIGTVYYILTAQWIVYFLLAVYLDNVLANENGVRRRPWYFLLPSYWGIGGRMNLRRRGNTAHTNTGLQRLALPGIGKRACPHDSEELDPDVQAEAVATRQLADRITGTTRITDDEGSNSSDRDEASRAIDVFGLQKVFRPSGLTWLGHWNPFRYCNPLRICRRKAVRRKPQDFWALRGPWLRIQRNNLFCLLGPNGAGKSTIINVLTGVLPPSGGDALVFGEALSAVGGMDRIRSRMGVCPQFDILWHELTGREHLHIFAAIKGIARKDIRIQSAELLSRVQLTDSATIRTGTYSGGMRRRLSVAIALLGDPEVVYLDEPTTGMDPISRRFVWDIIQEAKPGRAVVLTTHSMEEADILGDTVAIMARGQLRALGTSLRLKQRFGSGYQISVAVASGGGSAAETSRAVTDTRIESIKSFFRQRLGVEPTDQSRAYLQWRIARSLEDRLPPFLGELEASSASLAITDIQISLTSLEEVFLSIAAKTEAAAAAAEDRPKETIHLDSGGTLQVYPGQDSATEEATGQMYKLTWAQDADGTLSIDKWDAIHRNEANLNSAATL